MNLNEYQDFTDSVALYPKHAGLVYTSLGGVGEASEFLAKVFSFAKDHLTGEIAAKYHTLATEIETLGRQAEVLKKQVRKAQIPCDVLPEPNQELKDALKAECADILWYVAQQARSLGLTLEEVAQSNVEKLKSRQVRNVLHGDGDNR